MAGEAEPRERRTDLVVEIGPQRGGALRLLTAGRKGDAARKVGEEGTVVEIGLGAGDGAGAAHAAVLVTANRRTRAARAYFALPSQPE